jgi:hypothetical protein
MTPEFEHAVLEYESLKRKEKEIKLRLDELKPTLLEGIEDDQEINAINGIITKKRGKVSWIYTQETQDRITALESIKKEEQRTGDAKEKYGEPFIEYRSN